MKIKDKKDIPVNEQILALADIELENSQTVSYYGIGQDCIIYLICMKCEPNGVHEIPVRMDQRIKRVQRKIF